MISPNLFLKRRPSLHYNQHMYQPIEESPVAKYIIHPCVARAQTMNEVTQLKAPIIPIMGSCTFSTLVKKKMMLVLTGGTLRDRIIMK